MYVMTDKKELAQVSDKWLSEHIRTYAEQAERYADAAAEYAEGVQAVQAEIDRRHKGKRSGESFVTEAIWNDNVTVEYDDKGQAVIYTGYYDKEEADV
jgi:hypothetical protein